MSNPVLSAGRKREISPFLQQEFALSGMMEAEIRQLHCRVMRAVTEPGGIRAGRAQSKGT